VFRISAKTGEKFGNIYFQKFDFMKEDGGFDFHKTLANPTKPYTVNPSEEVTVSNAN